MTHIIDDLLKVVLLLPFETHHSEVIYYDYKNVYDDPNADLMDTVAVWLNVKYESTVF